MKLNMLSFLVISLIGIIVVPLSLSAMGERPPAEAATVDKKDLPMSQEELQAAVISYANRFIATIGQAAYELENAIPTSQGRIAASRKRVYALIVAAEIAAGPNPGSALLDMVVLATLNRIVWEEYWRPQVFGMPATIMLDAYRKMETDVWDLAAKVMSPEQLEELGDLINDWRAKHPEQWVVDYIRFSDFGDLGKKPNLKEIRKPGGLLAPVSEATAAVDEVRMTSERAMFLLTKMQVILGFQAELVYAQLAAQPEVEKALSDISGFRTTADRFADLLEQMPDKVSAERTAMFKDAEVMIARERTAVLEAFDDKTHVIGQINQDMQQTLDRVDATIGNLQQTTADAEKLIKSTEQTVLASQALVTAVDRLADRFVTGESAEPSRPFDINEYIAALEKAQETVDSLNRFTQSVNKTSTPLITYMLEQFNDAADKRVDHIFKRLFQLLLAVFVFVLAILLVSKIIRK